MRTRKLICLQVFALLIAQAIPAPLAAQNKHVELKHPRYRLFDVGTFGGPTSVTIEAQGVLNKRGTLTGGADTFTKDPYYPDCFDASCYVQHAFRWHDGDLEDLGALSDPGSSIAYWVNSHEVAAGWSENGETDSQSGWPIWHAALWDEHGIHDLGTLGGAYSQANAMNDSGEVFGFAQNKTSTSCVMPVGNPNTETELRAVLWKKGMKPVDIGTLGGPGAFGQTINDRGQMAGFSYTSADIKRPGCPPIDPFFKEEGKKMKDLGTLGGTFGQIWWLNNRGQVVGTSNLKGDQYFHAFFWGGSGRMQDLGTFGGCCSQAWWINEQGEIVGSAVRKGKVPWHWRPAVWGRDRKIRDLGTLPGDRCGFANAVNWKGQIVGTSVTQSGICGWPGPGMTAVLWEDNKVIDLNKRIDPGAGLNLAIALEINDRGDIAGIGVPPGCDSSQMDTCGHAFVLTPCDDKHRDDEGCDYSLVDASLAASVPAATVQPPHDDAPGRIPPAAPLLRGNRYRGPTFSESNRAANYPLDSATPSKPALYGYCAVDLSDHLTGECVGSDNYQCVGQYDKRRCPPGRRAIKPALYSCQYKQVTTVDAARFCPVCGGRCGFFGCGPGCACGKDGMCHRQAGGSLEEMLWKPQP